jgi:hypothetical protein
MGELGSSIPVHDILIMVRLADFVRISRIAVFGPLLGDRRSVFVNETYRLASTL